jgi:hypothetical protein
MSRVDRRVLDPHTGLSPTVIGNDNTGSIVTGRQARAVSGELGMAFGGYSSEQGWALLQGPSGSAGHKWNEPGFDGMAFRPTGKFEMHILDNKSLARPGNIGSSTALTTNLLQNIEDLEKTISQSRFNDVPRIREIRTTLYSSKIALASGKALPQNVKLIVTNFGGQSTGVAAQLAARGVEFRDLTNTQKHIQMPPQKLSLEKLSPRSQGRAAGVQLLAMIMAYFAAKGHEESIKKRIEEELKNQFPKLDEIRKANPHQGILIVAFFHQSITVRDELGIYPKIFSSISYQVGGLTKEEAIRLWQSKPMYLPYSPPKGYRQETEFYWMPPLQ